jgi:hypothetical protein
MSSPTPTTTDGGSGAVSALISLITLVCSFFDSPHVWLQNITLLISVTAGVMAIRTATKKK